MEFEIRERLESNAYLSFDRSIIFNKSLENRTNKVVWINDKRYEE